MSYVMLWYRKLAEGYVGTLYDYVARAYDPVLGRFISADTIVPGAGNSQALNRYSYVRNAPLQYNDPSGHVETSPDDNGCGAAWCFSEESTSEAAVTQAAWQATIPNFTGAGSIQNYGAGSTTSHQATPSEPPPPLQGSTTYHTDVVRYFTTYERPTARRGTPVYGCQYYGRIYCLPDIVDDLAGMVWEVKPDNGDWRTKGPIQLRTYLGSMPGYVGGDPYTFIVPASNVRSPLGDTALRVVFDTDNPGMLYYTPVRTVKVPDPVTVVEALLAGLMAWVVKTIKGGVPPVLPPLRGPVLNVDYRSGPPKTW